MRLVMLDAAGLPTTLYGNGGLCQGAFAFWNSVTTGNYPGEMVPEFSEFRWTGIIHVAAQVYSDQI